MARFPMTITRTVSMEISVRLVFMRILTRNRPIPAQNRTWPVALAHTLVVEFGQHGLT